MSLYIGPKKEVAPCCVADLNHYKMENVKSKDDIVRVLNSEDFRNLRRDLLAGIKNPICGKCWKSEEIGARSIRQNYLTGYSAANVQQVVASCEEDFSIEEPKFLFMDIRFNNKCNLKCRSCSSHFSSLWHADEVQLGIADPHYKKFKVSVEGDMMQYIFSQLHHVERIYFAGGEPLIQDEHYAILDKILAIGREKEIHLSYNTNFSTFKYRDKNVLNYWRKFRSVVIGASLDGNYERGEYIRKGLVWVDAVENKKRLQLEAPNVMFHINCTLGILNAYNIIDFHKEWVNLGLIRAVDFNVNLIFHPELYSIKNLPNNHKERLVPLYRAHIEWLKTQDAFGLVKQFESVINLLAEPQDGNWRELWVKNEKLDAIRNEDFHSVFPEYADL